jgi:hypothetical protein
VRVGYAKLGRSMKFDENEFGFQGDAEAANLLRRLARRNRDVTWVLVGRNTLGDRQLEPNVENFWATRDADLDIRERKELACPHGVPGSQPRTGACSPTTFERKLFAEMAKLDAVVIHVGQSCGTVHTHIPRKGSTWRQFQEDWQTHATRPLNWAMTHGAYLTRGLNALGDATDGRAPVVWLVTDPRNNIKARDLKWPTGLDDVLAQYQFTERQLHNRYTDGRTPSEFPQYRGWNVIALEDGELWRSTHSYRYGGLETMMLPDDWNTWGAPSHAQRVPLGVATTSFAATLRNEPRRSELVRDWMLAADLSAEVYGKWDRASLDDVPPDTVKLNDPGEFQSLLERWRVTIALPVVGSSWTTAKPYQCFAARTVCFYPGRLDDQGWTLPSRRNVKGTKLVGTVGDVKLWSVRDDWTDNDLRLASWLRVETPSEFHQRARWVSDDEYVWRMLVGAQRELLQRRWDEHFVETTIERKLGLRQEEA